MTLIQIGIERNLEGRTLAWALDFPGVFAYGTDDAEALIRIPREILRFENWLNLHANQSWVQLEGLDMHIDEIYEGFQIQLNDRKINVGSFFRSDLVPLSPEDVRRALLIFNWQREELLAGVETIPEAILKHAFEGQRWTIEGILTHIARAELWYFSRLGFETPEIDDADSPLRQLEVSSELTQRSLPELISLDQVFEYHQENWSARKLVRRLLWHQRDHIDHIRGLVLG